MDSKHYTQVLIDGKVYTLGGSEDEGYLQRVASYVNEKIGTMRRLPGFTKQNNEYQTAMIALNIADDYFKAQEEAEMVKEQRDEMERETYSLKHELVSTQMKLEAVLKDLAERQSQLEALSKEKGQTVAVRFEGQEKKTVEGWIEGKRKPEPEGDFAAKEAAASRDQELTRKAIHAAMEARSGGHKKH